MIDSIVGATLDHIAIAVRDIGASLRVYGDLLGARFMFAGDQIDRGFRWAQFAFPGGGKIEFITPLHSGSFIDAFIESRGEGPHHLTLKVPDIATAVEQVRAAGIEPIRVSIERAGWKEAFIHPKDASGTLVQLAQADWTDEEMARHHLEGHAEDDHHHVLLEEVLKPNPLFVREPVEG